MSEILILEKYPVKYITDIFVYSLDAKKIVQDALNKYRITHIEIRVEPNFFKK
ncbi:MAG: DarT ssDNA thymidine ADP-ribosyltransferase family protein [Cetobacterium sp.]